MNTNEEIEQFQLLEEKIDSLLEMISSLKKEKSSLAEKVLIQEEKLTDLAGQVEKLKGARDSARQRIVAILEKIEQIDM